MTYSREEVERLLALRDELPHLASVYELFDQLTAARDLIDAQKAEIDELQRALKLSGTVNRKLISVSECGTAENFSNLPKDALKLHFANHLEESERRKRYMLALEAVENAGSKGQARRIAMQALRTDGDGNGRARGC